MSSNIFETPIEFLKGVGPRKSELLKKELGLKKFGDLATYYPFRYVDRSKFYKVSQVNSDAAYVQVLGRITSIKVIGKNRGKRLSAIFSDETGSLELVWFKGVDWISTNLKKNVEYVMFGKPNIYQGRVNIVHPDLDLVQTGQQAASSQLQAVYSSTERLSSTGLNSKGIWNLQKILIPQIIAQYKETLSVSMIAELDMLSKQDAIKNIHFPGSIDLLNKAEFRLKFEELFFVQLQLIRSKISRINKLKGFKFPDVGEYFNLFYKHHLEFELTNAQKRVVKEIRTDLAQGVQMNRLLQGDVGSGKTIVAVLILLLAIDNGYQGALMAPTEILAIQHFKAIDEIFSKIGLKAALLSGSSKVAERRVIHEELMNGKINLLIGTHALIEDKVEFQNLGLIVIDEQHRFGVAQRAKLWKKNKNGIPHVLVMTATPIPRTLAMSFYGDLDISVIDELPPGRKPIKTIHRYDSARLNIFGFMKEEIKKGRQIYLVYPLIKESEKMDYKDLMDGYESVSRAFPIPEYQISIVHGQMKAADKEFEMNRFIKGETQILVGTTVIEVGINVPNASVMIIESAERFGLPQLHQLRGRVGRGADQSYCVLITGPAVSADGKLRMKTMVNSNDGFEIAEVDLKLRGPGDIMGTQQSGIMDFKIADLGKDVQILQMARDSAFKLLEEDPDFRKAENAVIANEFNVLAKGKRGWSRIS
ncbi:MAG: ATP-dependent DNA helicase RecG [Flavobacteriales bacterium]|nr:ATP-dependent DNA helicase RecG [Flavobacteriales bacterium]